MKNIEFFENISEKYTNIFSSEVATFSGKKNF